jgi:hypothetical protein
MLITGYRLGEGWVGHRDRVAEPQKMMGTGIFFQKPPYRIFLAAVDPKAAIPCRSSDRDPPPSYVALGLSPRADVKLLQGKRLLASAVP